MDKLGYTFYPKDFISDPDVMMMTPSERGIYRDLIDLAYMSNNCIKYSLIQLSKYCNAEISDVENILKLKGLKVGEYWTIPSCNKRILKANVNRDNGAKGGRPSKPKDNPNNNPTNNPNKTQTERQREREREEEEEEEISMSGKPDYEHIYKGWVNFINKSFGRKYTTEAWKKKTFSKVKQLLKDYKTKENLAEALITVCNNIAKDEYHIETNFKYATPEYIARPDIFDKHLNTISKVDAKQSERWQKPEDIYFCVDWIDKIPCPPKDLNGDEAAMFMYIWRISELMHYQQDRQGVHSNLSEHAEF